MRLSFFTTARTRYVTYRCQLNIFAYVRDISSSDQTPGEKEHPETSRVVKLASHVTSAIISRRHTRESKPCVMSLILLVVSARMQRTTRSTDRTELGTLNLGASLSVCSLRKPHRYNTHRHTIMGPR